MNDWKVEIMRYPTDEDWKRCLMLARATQGKNDNVKEPSIEWRQKILVAEHSPIRTLMFTVAMIGIPYYSSVHFVRHKYGVEHFVESQRKNTERGAERQDAPVNHYMDLNAQALIAIARKRLCSKADETTRTIMREICKSIFDISQKEYETWGGILQPACGRNENNCREFKPCGIFRRKFDELATPWAMSTENHVINPLGNPFEEVLR